MSTHPEPERCTWAVDGSCPEPAAALVALVYLNRTEPTTGWHAFCLHHAGMAGEFAAAQAASTVLATETRIRPLAWGRPIPAGR